MRKSFDPKKEVLNMQKESRKETLEQRSRENAELAKNRIKFECLGLDYFGMLRFADFGAQIVCTKEKKCKHECKFRGQK